MDHERSYAFHIAQAIRHKKAMKDGGELGNAEELDLAEPEEDIPLEEPAADPKEARRERIKAILAR